MSAPTVDSPTVPDVPRRAAGWKGFAVLGLLVVFAAFWTWALFFASKEAVNRIDDRAWAERAERICAVTADHRETLADYTRIDVPDPQLIQHRADLVDAATGGLDQMLTDIAAEQPSDAKGTAIVPDWLADYRTYLVDRRTYADELRRTGRNLPFYETAEGGIPISEKVATFAGDNEMPSCSPPRDLS